MPLAGSRPRMPAAAKGVAHVASDLAASLGRPGERANAVMSATDLILIGLGIAVVVLVLLSIHGRRSY